jgi:hypothetical protein
VSIEEIVEALTGARAVPASEAPMTIAGSSRSPASQSGACSEQVVTTGHADADPGYPRARRPQPGAEGRSEIGARRPIEGESLFLLLWPKRNVNAVRMARSDAENDIGCSCTWGRCVRA